MAHLPPTKLLKFFVLQTISAKNLSKNSKNTKSKTMKANATEIENMRCRMPKLLQL
jgi:hypothetical protein